YDGPPLSRSHIGIQLHLHGEDIPALVAQLRALNVGWVKVQVSWKLFQPEPNRFDEAWFQEVDKLVTAARENDMQVMLGVAKAPEWSRPTTEMDGPPSNPQHFADFMSLLATRYSGQVAVYELWNETNLQREWNGAPLNGAALVNLIAVGSQAVKTADPAALVLSGAPAPTGINDGLTAVDDRVYFQQMVDAGVAQWVDGFGIHPYGWGNPPLSTAANPDPIALSHNNHPSFFFLDTLNDYHAILQTAGIDTTAKQLWPTEFGWGTFENIGEPVAGTEFMNYVSEWQQAEYILAALAFGEQTEWVGPMLLWNLNFAPTLGTDFSESGYSILRPDQTERPIYGALRYALAEG
ncbi:MAG: cellulase family glycosylhydrolase, partial [Anaerolineales bacterium]|nr:cellulase family glycosylhydrolase [Anaerolineales bacterium]